MGLFGSAQKSKTTVKPSPQVEKMLRDIASRSQNINEDFIAKQFATLTPEEQQAITNYAGSGALTSASAALSPRYQQGIEQMTSINKDLQSVIDKPISAQQVLDQAGTLKQGLYKGVQQTAANAGGVSSKFGAAGRAAARRGASQQAARNALNPNAVNQAINMAGSNQANLLEGAGRKADIAQFNQQLGQQGIELNNQALQNKLNAGNFMQSYQQAMNTNNWENANNAQLFPWQKAQNQLNVLNQISPMAGYTETTKGAATPIGQQIASAGLGAVSIYGKLGGFSGGEENTLSGYNSQGEAQYKPVNQWSNNQGTGMFNQIGSWAGGAK